MHDYDISGYANSDSVILCAPCFEKLFPNGQKDATPIFLNSEFEQRVFCEECGDEIEVTIIE